MSRGRLRPWQLFGLAAVLLVILILAGFEDRGPLCRSTADWFNWLAYVLGPLSVVAIYAGVVVYIRRRGWHAIVAAVVGLVIAAVWAGVGAFILVWVLIAPSNCLN